RRKYIVERLKRTTEGPKNALIVSETEYLHVGKLARFDMLSVYLSDMEYVKAIYHAYLLQREDPNSLYLKKKVAKALYALAQYDKADNKQARLPDYDKVE